MVGSLTGVRVLDVTTSVAGPFATLILGDLGADVIKIERPGSGDDTRRWGPPFWEGESPHFTALNRNKRSVTLDLKDPRDVETLGGLVDTADVLVQNLRPGALARHGFGYAACAQRNSRIIYCEMTGYGSSGPLAELPTYDPLMQAFSGLMSMNGADGGPPARIPVSILDQGTGMWAAIAILDALRERDRTGTGTHVEVSLLGTALMWQPSQFANYFAAGVVPRRLGSGAIGIYPYAAFPTADGWIVIAAGNQSLWQKLCSVLDRSDLLEDPRFTENADRVAHRDELFAELSTSLADRRTADWARTLENAGVPCAPIQTLDQVANHEQIAQTDAFGTIAHPRIQDFRAVRLPVRNGGRYPAFRMAPPLLGQHNEQLHWLDTDSCSGGTENGAENRISYSRKGNDV